MSFFSETDYDNSQKKGSFKPFFTIKDTGENTFRIAPACRSLATLAKPDYAFYNRIHFGHGVQDSENPDRIRARPFVCIHQIDFKTKMVKVACPECVKIDSVKKEMEALKADLAKQGHPEDYVKQATSPQFQWLREHNLDSKWYCYAKNLAGEWNVLKIGHKTKLALDEVMKRLYKEDGIKALDPAAGVWFRFTKNGMKGPKAITNVEVLRDKTEMNGQRVEVIRPAPLTENDVKAIEGLVDVTNSTVRLSYDSINALVESAGNPEVASRIFALGSKKEASPVGVSGTNTVVKVGGVVVGSDGSESQTFQRVPATTGTTTQTPATTITKPATPTTPATKYTQKEIAEAGPDAFLRMFATSTNKS